MNHKSTSCFIDITPEEKLKVKSLAKSRGMTLQGFLGNLVKKALEESEITQKQEKYLAGSN